MSRSNRRSNAPSGDGVIAAWFWFGVTCLFALWVSWEPTAQMLSVRDYQADEIECRRQHQQESAKRHPAAATDDEEAKKKAAADREKEAREYCVERRSAIAGERQADIARWAAGVSFLALVAAAFAVVFARRTLNTMNDTAKRQLRAYVVLNDTRLIDLFGANPGFEVNFKNTGQTPARDFKATCRVAASPFPLFGPLSLGPAAPLPSTSLVAPQGLNTVPLPAPRALTDVEKDLVRRRIMAFYVHGIVTYVDVFGDSHWTRFRVMCGGATGIVGGLLANCHEGNEMGEGNSP